MARPSQPLDLKAKYSSPSGTHEWSVPQQPISSEPETKERVSYLANLRRDISALQGQINMFLTDKMEEDKRTVQTNGDSKTKIDEGKEEENYGEEADDE